MINRRIVAETMLFEVQPLIGFENSLPYSSIEIKKNECDIYNDNFESKLTIPSSSRL